MGADFDPGPRARFSDPEQQRYIEALGRALKVRFAQPYVSSAAATVDSRPARQGGAASFSRNGARSARRKD